MNNNKTIVVVVIIAALMIGVTTTEPLTPKRKLSPLATWQLQLQGTVNTSHAVDMYDVDMFGEFC